MSIRQVFNLLCLLILALGGFMLCVAVLGVVWYYRGFEAELHGAMALVAGAGGAAVLGGLGWFFTRQKQTRVLGRREALLLVALSWFIGAAIAAVPYISWAWIAGEDSAGHEFHNFINCYFETTSGLTTTGATILTNIPQLPDSILLWRSLTHWLGGVGIVVLFVAVLPSLGVGGKKLFRVETPGPAPGGVRPHIRDTARVLWLIYLGMTLFFIIALRIAGMDWFDSICHTFSGISTGGLSPRNASVGEFDSVPIDIIIIFMMLAAGVNFGLYFQAIRGKPKAILKDTEFRVYIALKIIVIAAVAWMLFGSQITTTTGTVIEATLGQALRYAGFTTIAMHTGTGYCTADYADWPYLANVLIIGLMFIGGCAGSTAGGIKVIRFWIGFKIIIAELERAFRPNVVRPLKVGTGSIDPDLKLTTMVFLLSFTILWGLGAFLLQLFETPEVCDGLTAMTASLACIGNIGPGMARVGAVENYEWFSNQSKIVLSILMILGRLEVFTVIVLLTPRFWKGN